MQCLWYVGQGGIVIELVGAAIGVWFALDTRRRWSRLNPETYGSVGEGVKNMKDEFLTQFPKQFAAFGLIGLGLGAPVSSETSQPKVHAATRTRR